MPTQSSARSYAIVCLLLVSGSLLFRFSRLNDSLWLDEAWVANSIEAPTVGGMLFSDRFLQSSPAGFLLLERAVGKVLGYSELALRLLPTLSGLLGLAVSAIALRRIFDPVSALFGMTLLTANYWLGKYSQQVKQYSTDFLVSAVFIWLLSELLANRNGSRRPVAALLAFALPAILLSFTAAFWLPSCVLAMLVSTPPPQAGGISRRFARALAASLLLAALFTATYLKFIKPNQHPLLFREWAQSFLDTGRPLASLQALAASVGTVLFPLPARVGNVFGGLVLVLCLAAAALTAFRFARKFESRESLILLAGLIPVLTACLASAFHLYPVLTYPRMLIWALPCFVTLLCAALQSLQAWLVVRLSRRSWDLILRAVPVLCLVGAWGLCAAFVVVAGAGEQNREAMSLIQARYRTGDLLLVHGGVFEQFDYYRRRMNWDPQPLYIPLHGWPCCALNTQSRATDPQARDWQHDLRQAASRVTPSMTLWLLLPGARPGHWSNLLAGDFAAIPTILRDANCSEIERRQFGDSQVAGYTCLGAPPLMR